MGAINTPAANVVSLLDAFNLIGRRENADSWTGEEAAAVRLGQRSIADPDARTRGLIALRMMKHCAENGWLRLIYTSHDRRRVPYFESAGYWLSAIYPDPVGTGEGMIELDQGGIWPCVADVSTIKKWSSKRPREGRPGPKGKFSVFEEKCAEFFRSHRTDLPNDAVRTFVKSGWNSKNPWPSKSWGNDLIERARELQKELDRPVSNTGQTTAGRS